MELFSIRIQRTFQLVSTVLSAFDLAELREFGSDLLFLDRFHIISISDY